MHGNARLTTHMCMKPSEPVDWGDEAARSLAIVGQPAFPVD